MDAVNDRTVDTVVVMSSAQVGKTEIINNVVGYFVSQDPAPMLLIQPTLEMGQAWSKDRFAPMLRDTPVLRGKVKDPRSRDSGNTLMHKTFPGGHITIAGANSPAGLASRPIRIFLADEVDRFPVSAGTEGDPLALGAKRTTTFWNRKKVYTSTPTVKGASRIESAYDGSDQRRYHVPCPHCEELHVLEWANVVWDKDGDGDPIPETVRMACPECGGLIEESDKPAMLKAGRWVAAQPFAGIAGFHLNELYSPWRRWREVVADFVAAKDNPELEKAWTNTSLGESWEGKGESVEPTGLMARREVYEYPAGDSLVLTAGIDVQDNRLEMSVYGWAEDEECYAIDHRILDGPTDRPEVWGKLSKAIRKTYAHEHGDLSIAGVCVDSGYRSQYVHEWVNKQGKRVLAIKGRSGPSIPIAESPEVRLRRQNRFRSEIVGTDEAKSVIYARLRRDVQGPGYIHFPLASWCDSEFFEQLAAEKLTTKLSRSGYMVLEWQKTRPRNEALDCFVYAMAAVRLLNPDYDALRRRLVPQEEPKAEKAPLVPVRGKRRGRNFVNNWR